MTGSWVLSIDFGTSYTVAAVRVDERRPEVIEINGERRVPSMVVVLPDGEILVGHAAEVDSLSHPGSTLRAMKGQLGSPTPIVLGGRPYQVVALVAAFLRVIAHEAAQQMGTPPREVRLTHPASWNRPLRQRFLEAGIKAGLDNVVLIPEPVAAAMAHAADVGLGAASHIAIYDLGGGTFDCAVLRGGDFTVTGQASGDQNIGGELFDELMMNVIGERLEPAVWESIQVGDGAAWQRVRVVLRNEARKAKEALSTSNSVEIFVALPAGLVPVRLTRADFDDIARTFLAETVAITERCIAEAGLRPSDLSAIALVGGASRSPLVGELVSAAFPGTVISRRGDPKASVAIGAALAVRHGGPSLAPARDFVTQPASPGTTPQAVRLAPPNGSVPTRPTASVGAPPPAPPVTQFLPPQPQPPPEEHRPLPLTKRRNRTMTVLAGVMGIGAIAVGGWVIADRSEGSNESGTSASESSAAGPITESSEVSTSVVSSAESTGTQGSSTTVSAAPVPVVARPVQVFLGDSDLVTSAAFSPDGTSIAGGSTDSLVLIWDVATGSVLQRLVGHTDSVEWVAFDPAGSRLVTASSDGTAHVWDVATGEVLAVLQHDLTSEYHGVNMATFNDDGTLIVTASDDTTARIWDAATGAELHVLSHDSFVFSAVFSPDNSAIATASLDDTAKVWSTATGELIATLTGHTEEVASATFSPDGTRIVTASGDASARIWDAANGTLLTTLIGQVGLIRSAAYSPDGTKIVTVGDDHLADVWDAATGQMLFSMSHPMGVDIGVFTPDGAHIITLGDDYIGRIWNAADGRPVADLPDVVNDLAFSPDGRTLVTPSIDGTARLFTWSIG